MGFVHTSRNCLFILTGFMFIVESCSIGIEKRRYNPGYHVSVSQKHSRKVNKAPVSGQTATRTISGTTPGPQTVTAENDNKNRTAAVRKAVEPAAAKSTSF